MFAPTPSLGSLSGIGDAVTAALCDYTAIEGRTARRAYWLFMLFVTGAGLLTLLIDLGLWRSFSFTPLNALFAFLMLIPTATASVRRLHDVGRSGWWLGVAVVPLAGAAVLIYWTAQAGDAGGNDYGLPP